MKTFGLLCVILAIGVSGAFTAERTVCFHLQFADSRYNSPDSTEVGARRPRSATFSDAVGHQIELWDKDQNSDDDYIGTWYISAGGTQCVTFEWENSPASKGEPNPDVYLRYINTVNRTGFTNYITVKAVTTDGSDHLVTSWRNGPPGEPDRYVARNIVVGTTGFILPSGSLVPTTDPASSRALRIMALDSAQHTLQILGEMMNRHVRLHYPGREKCTTSCTDDRENFHIYSSQGGDGILVGHELGHVIQIQRFGQDDLRDDVSKGGDGWALTSDEFDSGATQEGFASYVGIVSWYDPNRRDTVPRGWGLDFETATPHDSTCSVNRGIPLQVAKAFWDVDDWNDEAASAGLGEADDTLHYRTEDIIAGWDHFANGTGNRQNDESDRDGVNVRDYYENNRNWFTATGFFNTFVRHNCLQDQAND